MGTKKLNFGGNLALDKCPIQGRVEILLVVAYHKTEGKRWPDGPLELVVQYAHFPLPTRSPMQVSRISKKKNVLHKCTPG